MANDDEFERLARSVPELGELDNGVTVTISHGGSEVRVTEVEYLGWVNAILRQVATDCFRWFDALDACASQPRFVQEAVVHRAYREIAVFVFEEAEPGVMSDLFAVMRHMALSFRSNVTGFSGEVDHG
jgi:hypothetical protein